MRRHIKIITIASALIVGAIVVVLAFMSANQSERERNGHVVGDNPNNIPIDELPVCNFTGAGYLKTPCYKHDDTINL